jgi:hypothetical protein
MKILKSLFFFIAVLFLSESSRAQSWTSVSSARGNFSFQLPSSSYTQKDTLNTLFYDFKVDTLLGLDVHHMSNVQMIQNDSLFTIYLNQNSGDTLRAVGSLMLTLTNGQLVSIQNISPTSNNPKGLEIGIQLAGETSGNNLMFSRIYYSNGKFTAFTTLSLSSDAIRLGIYKTAFFNSISFAQP